MTGNARNVGAAVGSPGREAPEAHASGAAQQRPAQAAVWRDDAEVCRLLAQMGEACGRLAEILENRVASAAESSDIGSVDMCGHQGAVADIEPERLLAARDVASLLQVNARTVRRWRSEGKLPPAIEISGVIRWHPGVIRDWLADGGRP